MGEGMRGDAADAAEMRVVRTLEGEGGGDAHLPTRAHNDHGCDYAQLPAFARDRWTPCLADELARRFTRCERDNNSKRWIFSRREMRRKKP